MVEIDAVADPRLWPTLPSIVVDRTRWIVDTVGEAGVKATFFVLGWVARRHPEIAKAIADGGHEIATHSFWHRRVDRLTPDEFRQDLRESIDVLEQPSGRPMPELPMSVLKVGPVRLPFSGGGYLRLLPPWMIRRGFDTFNRSNLPVVVYLHPRDFAPDCPRVPMPLHRKFKCYVGIKSTQKKLKMLLGRYAFTTCADVLGLTTPGNGPNVGCSSARHAS